jgi:hypothetical protein
VSAGRALPGQGQPAGPAAAPGPAEGPRVLAPPRPAPLGGDAQRSLGPTQAPASRSLERACRGAEGERTCTRGGLRFSRTDATNGSVTTFGAEGGIDYFVFGRNNEGLRVGPRLELAFGRESFQTATDFGWLGLSGEVGYNFVASNGITGLAAVGLGGRIAGHKREDFSSFTGGEFGPYAKLGVGYSW